MCEITRVMFRKWYKEMDMDKGSTIIALFPDQKEHSPGMVMSYMRVGQHGAAHLQTVIGNTKPAADWEYRSLKRELESPPFNYKLKVIKRRPH